MARGDCERIGQDVIASAFSGAPTLGLGLPATAEAGPLARRAEESGFSALWVPSCALGAVAAATTGIAIVAVVDVPLSPDVEPALPDPAHCPGEPGPGQPGSGQLGPGRLAYALRFADAPSTGLSARACRKAGSAVMRKIRAAARKTNTPVLIQGSCHESLEWIAEQAQGWVYDRGRLTCVPTMLAEWRRVAGAKPFIQMLADGPGLEARVAALLRDGVDHVAIMPSGTAGTPGLWRLPREVRYPDG